ncbi:hypothetical protein AA0313_2270 [Acetobacter indonesiensis NRIC 0313]|nr:hypothetical protein AA0313_2270 [Acetobacter indonesiensis NRIC 0313]
MINNLAWPMYILGLKGGGWVRKEITMGRLVNVARTRSTLKRNLMPTTAAFIKLNGWSLIQLDMQLGIMRSPYPKAR